MRHLSCKLMPILLFSFFCNLLHAQNYEKVWFDKTDSVYGFYTVIKPTGPRIQGAVVLFDGYSGNASGLLADTKIHNVASDNELLTVCIPTGMRLFLDDAHAAIIRKILNEVSKTYSIPKNRWADRKSTRLNSSHQIISYAAFCLKKKKNHTPPPMHT